MRIILLVTSDWTVGSQNSHDNFPLPPWEGPDPWAEKAKPVRIIPDKQCSNVFLSHLPALSLSLHRPLPQTLSIFPRSRVPLSYECIIAHTERSGWSQVPGQRTHNEYAINQIQDRLSCRNRRPDRSAPTGRSGGPVDSGLRREIAEETNSLVAESSYTQ